MCISFEKASFTIKHAMSTLCIAMIGATEVSAQECPLGWAAGPLMPDLRGADGPVRAVLVYDPPGALPAMLFVGGDFTHIGNIAANHIAFWDGAAWRPLDQGTDGPVHVLIVFNNNLIVGGDFDHADVLGSNSRHIAAWNGTDWLTIGNGLGLLESEPSSFTFVSKLTVFNGQLIIGGRIRSGSSSFKYVFRLNGGTTWQDVSHPEAYEPPNFLEVFDEDGPGPVIPLVYCDCYDQIPVLLNRWNGTVWDDFLPAPTMFRYASTITNDGLVVAGNFGGIYLGDNRWDESIRGIAAWDGESWSGYGTGIVANYQIGEKITAVRQFGNDLYVAGNFLSAGGTGVQNMARWNGSQWISTGLLFSGSGYHGINEMRVHNNELIVGGDFNLVDAFGQLNHLARYNGSSWSALKSATAVNALATFTGPSRIVLGGTFAHVDDLPGTPDAYHLATWNGKTINPLGGGVNGPVHALKSFSGPGGNSVIVAGEFTYAGSVDNGMSVNRIATWDEPLIFPGSWSAMGTGFNGTVLALETLASGGGTVAGGAFTASGSGTGSFNRVARWSGSPGAWAPMNAGFNGTVRAIKSYPASFPQSGSVIVAGGDFTTASGGSANRIAIWTGPLDNHASGWAAMGSGFNGTVHAIERYGNSTYAAGAFTASGATALNHVARWNGSAWVAVGNGLNGNVYELKAHNGFLYAACEVTVGGGLTASRWDGRSWTSLQGGVTNGAGYAILPFQTELIFGGSFEKAQGTAIASPGLARWRIQGIPWVVSQPLAQSKPCGGTAVFQIGLPTGYEDIVAYQWFKDGAPLSEGWTGTGSYIIGATTSADLQVVDVSDADEGMYHAVVSTSCGSITTSAAALTAINTCPPCPIDIAPPLVGNGVVNTDDLLMVINSWGACPIRPSECRADVAPLGGNNMVNADDLLAVINAWGRCP